MHEVLWKRSEIIALAKNSSPIEENFVFYMRSKVIIRQLGIRIITLGVSKDSKLENIEFLYISPS